MSLATLSDRCRIAYRLDGPPDRPVLVLSNSLGTHMDMWAPQVEALASRYRVLRYDTRGHGRSDVPPGAYSIERLGRDVCELLDQLGLERVHFCGLSLGGMTGQWLGVHEPRRIERLILANTAAWMGPPEEWQKRIEVVLRDGMGVVADASLARWFSPGFRASGSAVVGAFREMLLATPPVGYAGCCAAIRDLDLRDSAHRIAPETLIVAGSRDPSTPPDQAEEIALALRSTGRSPTIVTLEAAHLSNAEQPERFSSALVEFLERPPARASRGPSARRASGVGIERVETLLLDLPTIRPHALAMTTMRRQTVVLVRVHASDGITGVGEGTTIGGLSYGEESPEGIQLAIERYLAPALSGFDPRDVARAMHHLARVVKGNHFAKCAVETALLDAAGRRAGLPLADLLGGRVHDQLEVAWTLASGDTHQDIAEAEEMLDRRRHRIFKLKIGSRPVDEDVRHVAAIKRALGERASVRVDVNQAWDESMAMRGMAALEAAGVDLVEQPVARTNLRALGRLAARFIVPVMADESLHGPESAFEIAREAAADVFAIKISPSGGVRAAARVAAIADAAGIGLYGGTMLESGLGTAAAAQLCATFPKLAWGTELFGPLLLTEEILREPLAYREFSLLVPAGPGLGVELDEERVEAFRRDSGGRRAYSAPSSGGT